MSNFGAAQSGGDNVFRDLGFPEAEAQNLLLRGNLVIHIRKVIEKLGITQAEAAKRAGITQPRMNDLVKNRTHSSLCAGSSCEFRWVGTTFPVM